jgi:hypothetical protein
MSIVFSATSARLPARQGRRRRPEQELQRAIIDHLHWRGHVDAFFFHYPAGGWRSPIEAKILKALGTIAGVPDLIIIFKSRIYCLELKAENGRVTDVQHVVHERLRRAGAEVATAFGLDQALAQLMRWGLLRGRPA